MTRLIKIGQIVAPHGIKGLVKINACIENPRMLNAYGPIVDKNGSSMDVKIISVHSHQIIAAVNGVSDRNTAENLRGTDLFVNRESMPDPAEETYYYCDLIGLCVQNEQGTLIGMVKSVENYGASDILQIETTNGKDMMIAFTQTSVLNVDLDARILVIHLPEEVNGDKA